MLGFVFTSLTSFVFTGFDSFLKNDAVFPAESQIRTDRFIHATLKLFYHLIREGDTSNFHHSKQTCWQTLPIASIASLFMTTI